MAYLATDPWQANYNAAYRGGSGPTGIPDPNRPGYDTAGYPLSGTSGAPNSPGAANATLGTAAGAPPFPTGAPAPIAAGAVASAPFAAVQKNIAGEDPGNDSTQPSGADQGGGTPPPSGPARGPNGQIINPYDRDNPANRGTGNVFNEPAPGNDANQINGWISKFLGRNPSPMEVQGWLNSGKSLSDIQNAIANSTEAQQFAATGGKTPPPGGDGGLVDPFTRPAPNFQGAPVFQPPPYTPPPAFTPTTSADLMADPGYSWRMNEGQRAIEASAAARGVLNSSGNLKDLAQWSQNAASQEFQNVDTRRRNDFGLNYQVGYKDPYSIAYQGSLDSFSPKMAAWAAQNNWNMSEWLAQYQQFRDRRLDSITANTATTG